MEKRENPLVDETGALKPDARKKIKERATKVECECPTYLLKISDAIYDFQVYQTQCLLNDLKQREIHEWLLEVSHELELKVSEIIIELMQKEGFVDENFTFLKPPKIEDIQK